MSKQKFLSALTAWLAAAPICFGGVIVNQNVGPGATSWPGSPILNTVANPSTSSVLEGFNGGGGSTNLSQTFSIVTADCVLDKISIYAGGGSGTSAGTDLVLRLHDLGSEAAPNPSPYGSAISGANLLGSGAGLSVTYTSQTTGVLEFDFTGADEIVLTNGHMYAFELTGVFNTAPILWDRGIIDTYPGGAAYRNRSWINGNNARDFAMAVYASTVVTNPPSTNAPFIPSGIVFHGFSQTVGGINQDGANPAAGLLFSGGVLCGTTANGGSLGAGTAFYMSTDGSNFVSFRSFANPPDAGNPQGDLAGSTGRLFGTSFGGGTSGVGSVFAAQTNGTISILRSFSALSKDNATNSGGADPSAFVVLSGNLLFGVASAGGVSGNGTVFSVTTNGSASLTLYNFSALDCSAGTNTDGAVPSGNLLLSGDTLYGITTAGGAGGNGVVFSLKTNSTAFTTLHSFTPMDHLAATNTDGAMPYGGLILVSNTLYGTTSAGGHGGSGTIFSLDTNGSGFAVLHHFAAVNLANKTNLDGARPGVALLATGKVLYGTTPLGGAAANGTVFAINVSSSQLNTLYSFSSLTNGANSDGAFPLGSVVLVGGALYGTTFSGGPAAAGIVFSLPLIFPATILKIQSNGDGSATLYFSGTPGSTNVLQTTTALAPPIDWQNLSTNVANIDGEWQLTVTNGIPPAQFYRSYTP